LGHAAETWALTATLFADSTRLRLLSKRPSLVAAGLMPATTGSHEAPGPGEAARTVFLTSTRSMKKVRPREPPPPPPPVAAVLKPVVPPKPSANVSNDVSTEDEYAGFSSDEFESVAGSSRAAGGDAYDVAEYVEGSSGISTGSGSTGSNNDSSQDKEDVGHSEDSGTSAGTSQTPPHTVLVSPSSWVKVLPSPLPPTEPVKPPRLKKLAKLTKLPRSLSEPAVVTPRPQISAPVLLATTFNPNDAEGHREVSMEPEPSGDPPSLSFRPGESVRARGPSLKDLRRLSSSFLPSLSSLTSLKGLASVAGGRSSFYVAEAIYREAAGDVSPDHIYEEIGDETCVDPNASLRPLPPIPEQPSSLSSTSGTATTKEDPFAGRRGGSMFGGASKSEILQYLRNAKERIGEDPEGEEETTQPEAPFSGSPRNRGPRASVSSESSSSSTSSHGSSVGEGRVATARRLLALASKGSPTIERADSGVGSDASSAAGSVRWRDRLSNDPPVNGASVLAVTSGGCGASRCHDCNAWLHPDEDRYETDYIVLKSRTISRSAMLQIGPWPPHFDPGASPAGCGVLQMRHQKSGEEGRHRRVIRDGVEVLPRSADCGGRVLPTHARRRTPQL